MNAKQIIKKMIDIVNEHNTKERELKAERTKAVNRKDAAQKKIDDLGAEADMQTFKDLRNEVRDAMDEIDLFDMKIASIKKADEKAQKAFRSQRDELSKYIEEADKNIAKQIRDHALEIVKLIEESSGRLEEVNSVLRKYGNEIGIPAGELNGLICKGITSKTLIIALKRQAENTAAVITADGKVTGL